MIALVRLNNYVVRHAACRPIRMTTRWMATIRFGDRNEWHLFGSGNSNLEACADIAAQINENAEQKKWVLAQPR